MIRSNVGKILMSLGQFEAAEAHFREGIALDPEFPINYEVLAMLALTRPYPRPDEALDWLGRVPAAARLDFEVAAVEAQALLELDETERARAVVAQLEAARPLLRETVMTRLGLELYSGSEAEAMAYLNNALAALPASDDFRPLIEGIRAVLANEHEVASGYLARFAPGLAESKPELNQLNHHFATLYAVALQGAGEHARAERLLDALEAYIADVPRMGPEGFALTDVEIAVLRGDNARAIELLETAFNAGYRRRLVKGAWPLERYPVFAPLRAETRFRSIAAELEDYAASVRADLEGV